PPAKFCMAYLAADGAGNLWFTEPTRNTLGRVNPLDPTHIAEFTLPPCRRDGCFPLGVAPGPDGNVWFTMNGSGVGRVTAAGAITEFAITGGAPGDIWFTDRQTGADAFGNPTATPAIGRLDPKNLPAGSRVCPTGARTKGFWQTKNGQTIINGADQSALSTWVKQFNPFADA